MKVLILNIDHIHRSVYSGLIAACLLQKIPSLEISCLVAAPNNVLSTTNHFKKVHSVDMEDFFSRTKSMSSTQVEQEIKKILEPVAERWDVVINLSSNLIGSIFLNFLDYKEVKGPFLDKDLTGMKFNDAFSFFLSQEPLEGGNFFHFTFLYRSILKRFEAMTLASAWKKTMMVELADYFAQLKSAHKKERIVFIDAKLCSSKRSSDINFVSTLYQTLLTTTDNLPILLGDSLNEGHPLIKKLKESVKGEVHALELKNEAQLSVISQGNLVITGDLYTKAIADLGLIPSLLIGKELDLNDFSIINGSHQIVIESMDEDNAVQVSSIAANVLHVKPLAQLVQKNIDVYRTITSDHFPILAPVNLGGTAQYAQWWLGLKFIARIQKLEVPDFKVNQRNYKNAIINERRNLTSKEKGGLLGLVTKYSSFGLGHGPYADEVQISQSIQQFLKNEEMSL